MSLGNRSASSALALMITAALGLAPDPAAAQQHPFEPLRIERQARLSLDGVPADVLPLLSPEGRHRLAGPRAVDQEVVFRGPDGGLSGSMLRTIHRGSDHADAWDVVADYDRDAWTMRRVHFEPGTELLMEDIRLASGPDGGTIATISWRVVGLSEHGNAAVQRFMDDYFEASMERLQASINTVLSEKRG